MQKNWQTKGLPTALLSSENIKPMGEAVKERVFPPLPKKGLYLSVLLRPDCPPMDVINLTAWTAVAVCDAIEQLIGERPGIKWTNDIILHDKKLCGILTEMGLEAESGQLQYVVIGVGVNVLQDEQDFSGELSPIAISL